MSLSAGTRIGSYEIVCALGAGGMGEVYRARDTKLGRDVAVKVLPELFANDADRLARFQREAQLLASLSHPNIGTIHGIEDAGTVRALVLELVEGETLADRIRRGPLEADEAVAVARQIADALEAAHERGVIHRDLKPANVKITPDGKVKVLDFGLAKAMDTAPSSAHVSHSPTLSLAGTLAGMVLGTAAYMSPEQAKGLPADQRSDVFSFGCVLFEMLTGRQAFQADTAAETLAAVLMRLPDLDRLPKDLHPRLRALVQRCLEKDPKRRWQAVGDLRFELEAMASDPSGVQVATMPRSAARPSLWRHAMPAVVTAVVVGAAASLATWWSVRPTQVPIVTRFRFVLEDTSPLLRTGLGVLALSPDGTSLVYAANRQLYLRHMADMEARLIPGTNLDAVSPFFSPNGQWIAFFSPQDATLKKIAVTGGAVLTLCKTDNVLGASWNGNTIAFVQQGKGIMRVSADGGEPELIAALGASDVAYGPQLLEGGRTVLFTLTTEAGVDRWDKAQIVVQSVGSADRKVVARGGSDARYVATGHLVYALGSTILAVAFDLSKREAKGGPVPVVEGVLRAPNPATQAGVAHFATSANGSLVYLPGVAAGTNVPKSLALVDRTGRVEPLGLPPQPYIHPRLSPNGAQLVVGTDDGKDAAVWVYDMKAGGSLRRLTFGGRNQFPIWSRDGRSITFQSDRDGDSAIFRLPADGSGVPERLTKPEQGTQHEPESWSPDGRTLTFDLVRGNNQGVWTWSFDGDRKPTIFVDAPNVTEKHSVFSPNGKWLAYLSARLLQGVGGLGSGGSVFVEPFPPTGAKYQIASGTSRTPLWSPDGRQLFFHDNSNNRLVVVDVRTEPSFAFGTPTALPIEGTVHPIAQRNYDVTPDGKQFLVVLPASATGDSARRSSTPQINVVLNWTEELKTRVPIK